MENGEILRMSVGGCQQPKCQLSEYEVRSVGIAGFAALENLQNFFARRTAVGLVFLDGGSARRLAEVFLRQSRDPMPRLRIELRTQNVRGGRTNPAPVEALDRQHGLFAISEYVGVGNRQSELTHQLHA